MDSYIFYKTLYDRELTRRKDLDTAIGLPITILTVIVASNTYILKGQKVIPIVDLLQAKYIIICLTFISLFISAFYIMKSSNNLFKGFAYKNFALLEKVRAYEMDLMLYNNQVAEEKRLDFQQAVIEKLVEFTDSHIIFNDKRSKDLYLARIFLIISFILTGMNFITLTLNYIRL